MDSLPLTRSPTTSTPKSSRKRTSSSVTRSAQTKRRKMDSRQAHSNRVKRRSEKIQPKTRGSSGLARNECTSPPEPDLPCPSPSSPIPTENCPSFVSAQSGAPFGGSSTAPPRVHSKPVRMPSPYNNVNPLPTFLTSLRQDHVLPTSHDENKVRLQSYMLLLVQHTNHLS
jgi:hypothetical protein